ncbi:MAG: AbrB/MazE/SpoVT family DNA-binding domain-containing protein [Dehalococcoidia bacterium]|nr:AbrB/MazE/SpoVT family DNA-binding domain-containing protein [Dehalococcoidia bacterium]
MSDVRRSTIRNRRQITLPADICRRLGIEVGDSVMLEVEDGYVRLTPSRKRAVDALAAIQKAFQESGIPEEELLEEGRRVRAEMTEKVYGRQPPA